MTICIFAHFLIYLFNTKCANINYICTFCIKNFSLKAIIQIKKLKKLFFAFFKIKYFALLLSVDGEWGNWGEYQACNETCGFGYEIRTRECNNPPAVGGGTPCQGIDRDEQPECNAFPCPGISQNMI